MGDEKEDSPQPEVKDEPKADEAKAEDEKAP